MSFLNPAGLIALIGVPILIIIYIIKSRYEDRAVSSTFLWKLSQKFMKKRLPMQKLKKILLFIMQLLMVIAVSLIVAQPVVTVEGGGVEYVCIIDASASMAAKTNGVSRYDRACDLICTAADDMLTGSAMTVIYAGNSSKTLIKRAEAADDVKTAVKGTTCALGSANIQSALTRAQKICDVYPDVVVTLYTDREFEAADNIHIVNVSNGEYNAAVTALTAEVTGEGVLYTATLLSSGQDKEIAAALLVDDVIKSAKLTTCQDGVPARVQWLVDDAPMWSYARVFIETKDSLEADNQYYLCNTPEPTCEVLLVGSNPFFLEAALSVIPNVNLTVTSSAADLAAYTGFDLYVFDGIEPQLLPEDGSVWLVNPRLDVLGSNLTFGTLIKGTYLSLPELTDTEAFNTLTKDLLPASIIVSKFTELISAPEWETILQCGEMPVMLARENENGTRHTVTLFDIHNTNMAMTTDFVALCRNVVSYSLPKMLSAHDFEAGQEIEILSLPHSAMTYIVTPDGGVKDITSGERYSTYMAGEPGIYTALEMMEDDTAVYGDFYAHVPLSDSDFASKGEPISVITYAAGTAQADGTAFASRDGSVTAWPYIAGFMLVILIAEWGLYYREQF